MSVGWLPQCNNEKEWWGTFSTKFPPHAEDIAVGVLSYVHGCIGPYGLNGTPLRRVAQAYVAATQTKMDISSVKLPEDLTDNYFKRSKPEKKKEGDIFSDSKKVC